MRKIKKGITVEQLAAIITEQLESKGMSAVMVGGSVVSIYTNNEYESNDIDFVSPDDHREIKKAMEDLGFTAMGKDFYHPNSKFSIEFPGSTLAIGDEEPIQPEGLINVKGVKVKLYSPTQCVMDRLSSFYFFKDRQCLDQAVMVYKNQDVNLSKVKDWSQSEGKMENYQIFLDRIKNLKK